MEHIEAKEGKNEEEEPPGFGRQMGGATRV